MHNAQSKIIKVHMKHFKILFIKRRRARPPHEHKTDSVSL
jgi:hypothetical protein